MTATLTVTREAADAIERCPATSCPGDHPRGQYCISTRCRVVGHRHELTLICPRCRWLFGDTPTAYACAGGGGLSGWWGCAACSYEAESAENALESVSGVWRGPRYPASERVLTVLKKISGNGWHVPAEIFAVAVGRQARDHVTPMTVDDEVEHQLRYCRMPYFPGSGLADLNDDEFKEMLGLAKAVARS